MIKDKIRHIKRLRLSGSDKWIIDLFDNVKSHKLFLPRSDYFYENSEGETIFQVDKKNKYVSINYTNVIYPLVKTFGYKKEDALIYAKKMCIDYFDWYDYEIVCKIMQE